MTMSTLVRENKTKKLIASGGVAVGGFLGLKSTEIVEIMGYAGLDFVIIDSEHGSADTETLEHMVRAAEAAGITPIVRVTNVNDPTLILRALDLGAQGVQVPMVESAETARRIVQAAKYHPLGRRGLAGVRAARYGAVDMTRYVGEANAQTMVVAQIETVAGVEHAAEIAAVDGVDVVFVGPMDLSQSLGIPAQRRNPLLIETMEKVFAACKAAGKPCGTLTANAEEGRAQSAAGLQYLCISPAPIYAHCQSLLQGIRGQ
ncbi:MAG: aldolase/citrate lyase family protein [Bacillota bacterium]|nr:aldolase/citrate lyase family protein [Bacillota bacterium]